MTSPADPTTDPTTGATTAPAAASAAATGLASVPVTGPAPVSAAGPASAPVTDRIAALRPRLPSPLQEVDDERFARHGVRLLLKRDDLIHPELVENRPTGVGGL